MASNLFNVDGSSKYSNNIITFDSTAEWNAHFNALEETHNLMVVDFTAEWCRPCKLMVPVIQNLAAKYTNVEFIKVDVDELMVVSRAFEVEALPTMILIKRGKVVDKVVGVRKEELEKMIQKHRK